MNGRLVLHQNESVCEAPSAHIAYLPSSSCNQYVTQQLRRRIKKQITDSLTRTYNVEIIVKSTETISQNTIYFATGWRRKT